MNQLLKERSLPGDHKFQIVQGDITREEVDVIVNAANAHLAHGGGVAGVISRRGGPVIQRESDIWVRENGFVSHDAPAHTSAGQLPCKRVIHAVGPIWGSGDEEGKLAAAVNSSLRLADELGYKSIAFPAISTGIYGYPKAPAAWIIFNTIQMYFSDHETSGIELVRLTLFDQPTVDIFLRVWDEVA